MINIMLYSTSHTEYRPNWRGGGEDASSQSPVRGWFDRFMLNLLGADKRTSASPWDKISSWPRGIHLIQKASGNTDEINVRIQSNTSQSMESHHHAIFIAQAIELGLIRSKFVFQFARVIN